MGSGKRQSDCASLRRSALGFGPHRGSQLGGAFLPLVRAAAEALMVVPAWHGGGHHQPRPLPAPKLPLGSPSPPPPPPELAMCRALSLSPPAPDPHQPRRAAHRLRDALPQLGRRAGLAQPLGELAHFGHGRLVVGLRAAEPGLVRSPFRGRRRRRPTAGAEPERIFPGEPQTKAALPAPALPPPPPSEPGPPRSKALAGGGAHGPPPPRRHFGLDYGSSRNPPFIHCHQKGRGGGRDSAPLAWVNTAGGDARTHSLPGLRGGCFG